ncbi:MAG: glycosyltransferase family A protein [Lachnospiraceae bacterium]|nr:glycosyltransferase family A protein [Lachnospiraceae bacterium]
MTHTFSICAYQKSPYLERCIRSVINQSVPTKVILCTSTPNDLIQKLAQKYQIPLFIRQGKSDIQADWNYAWEQADTEYVTITHQDDMYHKDYAKEMLNALNKHPDTILAMTDYKIINEYGKARGDISLLIKQILKLPLKVPALSDKRWTKTGVQALGNAICCPSVCYNKMRIQSQRRLLEEIRNQKELSYPDGEGPVSLFQSDLKYALDWETFYQLAHLNGRFTYVSKVLFYYRMHEGTTTKKCLMDNRKTEEEIKMFRKFWPEWVVRGIMKVYRLSYRSYE